MIFSFQSRYKHDCSVVLAVYVLVTALPIRVFLFKWLLPNLVALPHICYEVFVLLLVLLVKTLQIRDYATVLYLSCRVETLSSCMVDGQGLESVCKMRTNTFGYVCRLVRVSSILFVFDDE